MHARTGARLGLPGSALMHASSTNGHHTCHIRYTQHCRPFLIQGHHSPHSASRTGATQVLPHVHKCTGAVSQPPHSILKSKAAQLVLKSKAVSTTAAVTRATLPASLRLGADQALDPLCSLPAGSVDVRRCGRGGGGSSRLLHLAILAVLAQRGAKAGPGRLHALAGQDARPHAIPREVCAPGTSQQVDDAARARTQLPPFAPERRRQGHSACRPAPCTLPHAAASGLTGCTLRDHARAV